MADKPRQAPSATDLLSACAVGFFFVWFETLFPLGMGLDGTDLSERPGFFNDLSWLASIAASCVGCVALGLAARSRAVSGALGKATRAKRCLVAGFVGAVAMAAGSAAVVSGSAPCWAAIGGGALSGLGAALLGASWLPGAVRLDDASTRRVVVLSVAASIAYMALLGAFSRFASLVTLAVTPLLAQGFAAAAMWAGRSDESADGQGESDDASAGGPNARPEAGAVKRTPLFSAQNAVTAVCFFAVFFVLTLIGSRVDLTLTTGTFWLVNVAGLANLVLLALLARFLDAARLKFVLVILAGTAVAAMPVSLLLAGGQGCFVLVKVATFFAYALGLLYIAETVHAGHGRPDSCGRALVMLGIFAGAVLVGTLVGNAVHALLGGDAMGTALVSVLLLWGTLVIVVLAAMSGRVRVMHVISGSFDDVSDIAQTRCGIIAEQHPDLSRRELDVLELVLLGYSTPRIAQRLVISENTAKTHLRHLYTKTGVGSRQELMALAEQIPVSGKRERASTGR